jgi:predicted component of type VI protein secretion system
VFFPDLFALQMPMQLLADRKTSTNQASSHHKKEAPQPRRYKPAQRGDDFLTKFQRNAGLVANGVARNLNKVGAYIKDTMDDIMYPYRKRPK